MRCFRPVVGAVLWLGLLAGCGGGGDGGDEASPAPTGEQTAAPGAAVRGKKIVVDPGHNGGNATHPRQINKQVSVGNGRKACDTTGTTTASGYREHAFTWDLANRLAKVLRAKGAEVEFTRASDNGVGPCITRRAATGGRVGADAAVSVHGDGGPPSGHGFHVIVPVAVGENAGIVDDSVRLGQAIREAYRSGTGLPYSTYIGQDGLDRRDDLGGLNLARVPTAFIECGNMNNAGDAAKMESASFRQRMADSIAQGFEIYFRQ